MMLALALSALIDAGGQVRKIDDQSVSVLGPESAREVALFCMPHELRGDEVGGGRGQRAGPAREARARALTRGR